MFVCVLEMINLVFSSQINMVVHENQHNVMATSSELNVKVSDS